MNRVEVEARLNDYLMKGVVSEIFWADQCKAVAKKIGQHSAVLNQTPYAQLFARLQEIVSDQQTLAVAKMYDRDSRTRSIPSILSLIHNNAAIWELRNRSALHDFFRAQGQEEQTLRALTSEQLVLFFVSQFYGSLPDVRMAETHDLSLALKGVLDSRNKVHAHNEAIHPSMRTRPTWGGTEALVDYAKEFVWVVGWVFLGISFGAQKGAYYLSMDAGSLAADLERLLKQASLVK